MAANLPDAIVDLLHDRVDSFEKLELIVALHGAPRTTLSVDDLGRLLKLPQSTIRETVNALSASSLVVVTSTGAVQLLPPTSRDHEAVVSLISLYDSDRLSVVTAMGEIALDRIRNMASRVFADAFLIRRKKGSDHG